MTRTLLPLSLSCLLAAFAAAQDTSPSTAPAQGNMQSATTVRGCLSGTAGNYTLTDDQSGAVYALSGNIDNLASEIGHQVEITGQPSAAPSSQDNTAASTAPSETNPQQMFQVNTVKDVADHCGSGSSSGSSAAPVNATAAAGDQAAPAPASSDGGSATMAQTTPVAAQSTDPSSPTPQTSEPAATPSHTPDNNTATATNSLPATASPLPLAGVIGFGSLLAGLYIRK